MSKASFEIAGIKFTDVDLGVCGISTTKLPSQEEVAAYERGRAAGRAEERADIVAWMRDVADELVATSDGNGGVAIGAKTLRIHAAQIEARAKAPAERQDARDGQAGTFSAGADTISRAGGVFP